MLWFFLFSHRFTLCKMLHCVAEAGRIVSTLQTKSPGQCGLWGASVTFLALLLSEEGRLRLQLGQERTEGLYLVSDRLDTPRTSGQ